MHLLNMEKLGRSIRGHFDGIVGGCEAESDVWLRLRLEQQAPHGGAPGYHNLSRGQRSKITTLD